MERSPGVVIVERGLSKATALTSDHLSLDERTEAARVRDDLREALAESIAFPPSVVDAMFDAARVYSDAVRTDPDKAAAELLAFARTFDPDKIQETLQEDRAARSGDRAAGAARLRRLLALQRATNEEHAEMWGLAQLPAMREHIAKLEQRIAELERDSFWVVRQFDRLLDNRGRARVRHALRSSLWQVRRRDFRHPPPACRPRTRPRRFGRSRKTARARRRAGPRSPGRKRSAAGDDADGPHPTDTPGRQP
jgi:hypothetical protein